jgi:hypothetical protein
VLYQLRGAISRNPFFFAILASFIIYGLLKNCYTASALLKENDFVIKEPPPSASANPKIRFVWQLIAA